MAIGKRVTETEVLNCGQLLMVATYNNHTERTGANLGQGGTRNDSREQRDSHSEFLLTRMLKAGEEV